MVNLALFILIAKIAPPYPVDTLYSWKLVVNRPAVTAS